ncbi:hypothetical protein GW17_00035934 [Ensete ventricosum]|nr:hypothetical protein GW17_00035934 [Ensete ventricosum]
MFGEEEGSNDVGRWVRQGTATEGWSDNSSNGDTWSSKGREKGQRSGERGLRSIEDGVGGRQQRRWALGAARDSDRGLAINNNNGDASSRGGEEDSGWATGWRQGVARRQRQ